MKILFILLAFLSIATVASAQCISGDCNNGFGMYKDSSYIYEGYFKSRMPHGKGRLIKAKGDIYEGGFEYGMYNGTGTLFMADNSTYNGSFHQGIKQGKGKITYADGKQYEGLFMNNRPITTPIGLWQLNFYSGEFEIESLANIDDAQQKINTEMGDFDIHTGLWLPSEKIIVFNINETEGYYFSKKGNIYDKKPIPKPTTEKNVESCNLMYLTNLENDNNYIASYLVSLKPKNKKDHERHLEVRFYNIDKATGKIDEINRFKTLNNGWVGWDSYKTAIQSNTGSSFFLPEWDVVYTNYGKSQVSLEKPESENFSQKYDRNKGNKDWFSENGDTIYRLDKGLQLRVFDVHTGKIIRSKRYTNNHFNTTDKDWNNIRAIIGVSEKSLKFVVIDGTYLKYMSTIGEGNYSHNKAMLLDLNDPDYMLPLQNPAYVKDYYDAISNRAKEGYAIYKDFRDAERKKILDKAGLFKSRPTLLSPDLDEYENLANNKTKKSFSREDMDNIIKSNSSSTQSGESAWDKLFREREKQSNKDYKMKNEGYRGY